MRKSTQNAIQKNGGETNGKYLEVRNTYFEEEFKRVQWLREWKRKLARRLKNAPDGTLHVIRKPSGTYYSKMEDVYDDDHKRHRKTTYLSKEDLRIAAALGQKSYDNRALSAIEAELSFLEEHAIPFTGLRVEEVLQTLNPEIRQMVTPVQTQTDQRLAEFLEMGKGPRNPYPFHKEPFVTKGGLEVRSKSEWMEAQSMEEDDILFYYELALTLPGYKTVYPDFTVLNRRTGQIYYWEHMGKMDDIKYVTENIEKIRAYERNGYRIGETLLLTFETGDQPIRTEEFQSLIEKYFK